MSWTQFENSMNNIESICKRRGIKFTYHDNLYRDSVGMYFYKYDLHVYRIHSREFIATLIDIGGFVDRILKELEDARRNEQGRYISTALNPDSWITNHLDDMKKGIEDMRFEKFYFPRVTMVPDIKKVIYSGPYTIVLWKDGSKTLVKCQFGDVFDKEKGLAMAICKKVMGTNRSHSNYNDIFKKWCSDDGEEKGPMGHHNAG